MAGQSVFSSEVLVRVCIICEEKVPEKYMAIFGCKDQEGEHICDNCKYKKDCYMRLVNPCDEDITAGICFDCLRDYGV